MKRDFFVYFLIIHGYYGRTYRKKKNSTKDEWLVLINIFLDVLEQTRTHLQLIPFHYECKSNKKRFIGLDMRCVTDYLSMLEVDTH